MGTPAAKRGDRIQARDKHLAKASNGALIVSEHAFDGRLSDGLSANVNINGQPAAMVGSGARNDDQHQPVTATTFVRTPSELATISELNQRKVRINRKVAACDGDIAETCNDPVDLPIGKVVASGNVRIG
jgi:uncharacterized Zn-binding protein involved in type VI secretion